MATLTGLFASSARAAGSFGASVLIDPTVWVDELAEHAARTTAQPAHATARSQSLRCGLGSGERIVIPHAVRSRGADAPSNWVIACGIVSPSPVPRTEQLRHTAPNLRLWST
jgi:hypothetical protein